MKKYRATLAIALILMTAVSCDKKEEPMNALQYRLSWIYSEDSVELFEYNSDGRVSSWEYNYGSGTVRATAIKSTYEYEDDGKAIFIKSDENYGHECRVFRETLYLNQDGTAVRAEGTVAIYNDNGELLIMMKNYTADFHYSSTRHLEKMNVVEKRTDGSGWEEPNGLEWVAELDWDEGNLQSFVSYSNPSRPFVTKRYSYLKGPGAKYAPVVEGSVLRNYYTALQYQGVFGHQSLGLVSEVKSTYQLGEQVDTKYTYDVAYSSSDSWVEGCTKISGSKEIEYVFAWDKNK